MDKLIWRRCFATPFPHRDQLFLRLHSIEWKNLISEAFKWVILLIAESGCWTEQSMPREYQYSLVAMRNFESIYAAMKTNRQLGNKNETLQLCEWWQIAYNSAGWLVGLPLNRFLCLTFLYRLMCGVIKCLHYIIEMKIRVRNPVQ